MIKTVPAASPGVRGIARDPESRCRLRSYLAADLRAKILDFRDFDSSRFLISSGGILISIGSFPKVLSQHIFSSRDNLNREIGRSAQPCATAARRSVRPAAC